MIWKTILVPHDFSASANHAAAIARDEAKLRDAKLIVLHVVELPAQFGIDSAMIAPESGAPISVREFAIQSAQKHVDDLIARLAKDGVAATGEVRVGTPVDEILAAAHATKADAIVMGTHGRAGFRKLIAGSVAERVIRSAEVPVLVVRHHDHDAQR